MPNLTLIGHGFIGQEIAYELDTQGVAFDWCHHTDDRWTRADVIINAAGYTGDPNVDACEVEREACIRGNILWQQRCNRLGHIVVNIGSGCVYEGGPFSEEDKPNFTGSFYSLCKQIGQECLNDNSYLLRIRMPFSRRGHPKNLLCKLMHYPKLVDVFNSLTCIEDAAKAVVWFATHLPNPGVYNLTNPGAVWTREIADMMGLHKEWFVNEAEFRTTVKAPRSNCTLKTDKLTALFPLRPVKTALHECVGALRQKPKAA